MPIIAIHNIINFFTSEKPVCVQRICERAGRGGVLGVPCVACSSEPREDAGGPRGRYVDEGVGARAVAGRAPRARNARNAAIESHGAGRTPRVARQSAGRKSQPFRGRGQWRRAACRLAIYINLHATSAPPRYLRLCRDVKG
ncbi:unnamed protein product [Colias eurytheme]|nr:unnamed protein product [Colias eurytheme]